MLARLASGVALVAAAIAATWTEAASGSVAARAAAARPAPTPLAGALYGDEREVSLSRDEASAITLARARLAVGSEPPRTSGGLVLAARELARAAADGQADAIAGHRIRAALTRALAYDPAPAAVLVQAPAGAMPRAIAGALPRTRATHVGAGAAERDGSMFVVLLASDRRAHLSPFPRDVAPGATAVLSGALAAGLARPQVFVTLPSGAVREVATRSSSGRFHAALEFSGRGRYVVEVIADGSGGPEVAALLTVAAGAVSLEPPAKRPRAREPDDEEAAEAAVVRAINDTRRQHGLAPLASARDLAAVARGHSARMAAAGTVAHVLPGSGDLRDRLRGAGVRYRRAYENVARAATALEAHEAAEESPAHLANVLRPDVTRVGIGIARSRLPSGDAIVYLTEVFVTPPDDGADSPLTPEGRVREALWRDRAHARLPPLTSDAALDALAREAAESMRARDATEAPGVGDRALTLRRGLAAVDVFVASAPAEAARSTNLRDARFRRVGVGVTTGDSRRFGAGRLWIAVVYTD
jgi:uncharacterized protein YkwD